MEHTFKPGDLVEAIHYKGRIILVTGFAKDPDCLKGVVIQMGACRLEPVGHYSKQWAIDSFKPYAGTLSIIPHEEKSEAKEDQKVRIRITGASHGKTWYRDSIGEEFNVLYKTNSDAASVYVPDYGDNRTILKGDYEVISSTPSPKRKVTELGEKEVIHCKTEEEAKDICRLMHEAGLKWSGVNYIGDERYETYRNKTCYCPGVGMYASDKFYAQQGYTIHPASYFL